MTGPSGYQSADHYDFLGWISGYGHNFTRLWAFENDVFVFKDVSPRIYERAESATAKTGKPKYDLNRFNEKYFTRLKSMVRAAQEREIYFSVVLFGHSGNLNGETYYKKENNINGLDGDPDKDGYAIKTRRLTVPAITAHEEKYVKKVVESVNELTMCCLKLPVKAT